MIYDIHAAIDQGKRDYQEDAVAYGVHEDMSPGFIVLADGMGGHTNGNTASGLVVGAVHDVLAQLVSIGLPSDDEIADMLHEITQQANASIASYVAANASAAGMGTTLVVPILNGQKLHWASVGDSPLYHFRGGELARVNEDHSLAPQLDFLASAGLMDHDEAQSHPDRGCLTSALVGATIPKIDCGMPPIGLLAGDIVVASSDGLLFLTNEDICAVLSAHAHEDSATITEALMSAVQSLDHPMQDNVSIVVVKVAAPAADDTKFQVAS
jgi:serine/threonine protein phosphatase PrpC